MDLSTGDNSLFEPGSVIADRYEVVRVLGAGSMGTVVRAIDRALDNEPAAIKLLYPHLVSDRTVFARFRNEVIIARRLSHPNIVRIYDFGKAGRGYYYISMEFVTGTSLKDRIYNPRYPELKFDEILRFLYEIGLGISHAHEQGVIHRDLKPDNILISDRGTVKVTDFGLARETQVDKGFTESGETVGTPCYMAPEQIRGERLDPRADIYSLGIMAYELVTGEKPFDSDNWLALAAMHMKEPLPEFDPSLNIPVWFSDFVQRSAAKDRADRFQSAKEWCEEIRSHIGTDRSASYTPAVFSQYLSQVTQKQKLHRIRKRLTRRAAVLAALVFAFVVVPIAIGRQSSTLRGGVLRFAESAEHSTGFKLRTLRQLFGVNISAVPETLIEAVVSGDQAKTSLLLSAGVDPNTLESEGSPILTRAIANGSFAISESLIRHGATVDLPDREGRTPLMVAAEHDAGPLVSMLLGARANPEALDSKQRSPLLYASYAGNIAAAQQLLKYRAFVHARDADGVPVIIAAINSGSLDLVRLLLDNGARVNDSDSSGWTPLMRAASVGNRDLVELLIAKGADRNAKNRDGNTAKDVASGDARRAINAAASVTTSVPKTTEVVPTTIRAAGNAVVVSADVSDQPTRLRVVGSPEGKWRTGKITKLLSVKTSIRNVGEVAAKGVKVVARPPGDHEFTLTGPTEIAPNSEAAFSYEIPSDQQLVPRPGEIKIIFTCSNCRR